MRQFAIAADFVDSDGYSSANLLNFEETAYRLKTIYELKKECSTFKQEVELSDYEQKLYAYTPQTTDLKQLKKH